MKFNVVAEASVPVAPAGVANPGIDPNEMLYVPAGAVCVSDSPLPVNVSPRLLVTVKVAAALLVETVIVPVGGEAGETMR